MALSSKRNEHFSTGKESNRKEALLELDTESREIAEIVPNDEGFLTLAKEEDVLFVGTGERIYAVDLESNEILEVYSHETGKLIYDDTGFFYDVETDGDMFYGLMNVAAYDGKVQLVSFHETDGMQEELTEVVEHNHVYSEYDVTLEM